MTKQKAVLNLLTLIMLIAFGWALNDYATTRYDAFKRTIIEQAMYQDGEIARVTPENAKCFATSKMYSKR